MNLIFWQRDFLFFFWFFFFLARSINQRLPAGLRVSVTASNPLLAPMAELQPATFRLEQRNSLFSDVRRRPDGQACCIRISARRWSNSPNCFLRRSVGVATSGRLCPTCHFSLFLSHCALAAGNLLWLHESRSVPSELCSSGPQGWEHCRAGPQRLLKYARGGQREPEQQQMTE